MKPTIELKTFDELAQYRRRIQTPASAGKQSGKKKITPAYILKNPLAPAAAFIGVAAAIFCIVSDMGFLPVYGAVCIALFGVMCAFMPAGAFVRIQPCTVCAVSGHRNYYCARKNRRHAV